MTELLTLEVGPMAHGGHCVARHEGRVVFVRHAIPGETVQAAVTDGGASAKFWRADAVAVLEPSEHRRQHPWPAADAAAAYDAGTLPVGGAELGHVSLSHQRRIKAHVFRDQLARIGDISSDALSREGFDPAHLTAEGESRVTALDGDGAGRHWRTRAGFAVGAGGKLAMRPHRDRALIPVSSMPLAAEPIADSPLFGWDFTGAERVDLIAPGGRGPVTAIVRVQGAAPGLEQRLAAAAGKTPEVGSLIVARAEDSPKQRSTKRRGVRRPRNLPVQVEHEVLWGSRSVAEPLPLPVAAPEGPRTHVDLQAESFWQIHRGAPEALTAAVDRMASLGPGGSAADLYAGAGLFTAWAADRVGSGGRVLAVEAAEASSASAARLFDGVKHAEAVQAPVEQVLPRLRRCDLVLIDPPRAGAGEKVLAGVDASAPAEIIYVSCDPASFARDAKALARLGWHMRDLEVIDMYPNTHHMESVAVFRR
ncbi:class I SAM-dependent RNA methyltransferase [Nesterenkonia populi]